MADNYQSASLFPQYEYVQPTNTAPYDNQLGERCSVLDTDISAGLATINSDTIRRTVLVKNGSGGTLSPGAALNWVTGFWGIQVQNCPVGSAIRCFVPSYVRGSISTTIPNGAYFYAVTEGYMSPLSDGSAIAVDQAIGVVGTAGRVGVNYGIGGGEVFSQMVASTVLTNTTVATKYDQNYTFPANSLRAGDTIRITGEISIPSGNSTNTLQTDLLIGATTVATLTAFDPTDAGGDIITVYAELEVRTIGASGTIVGFVVFTKNVNGTMTTFTKQLASTAIDTTAAQQVALQGTWSVANAGNQSRQDMFNVARMNATGVGLGGVGGGTAIAAAAGGSQVQFRAAIRCTW